jgi:hypothetical protein
MNECNIVGSIKQRNVPLFTPKTRIRTYYSDCSSVEVTCSSDLVKPLYPFFVAVTCSYDISLLHLFRRVSYKKQETVLLTKPVATAAKSENIQGYGHPRYSGTDMVTTSRIHASLQTLFTSR